MFEYSKRKPDREEILEFLKQSDNEFDRPLSAKLDVEKYACKLWGYSTCVTCRHSGRIVGMLNCYTNNPPIGYISNVCVLGEYQGRGVFARMFSILCSECLSKGIDNIVLQVNKSNIKARKAYSVIGFVEQEDAGDSLYLKYEIPIVTVICCTYNQELYIRQCLEGFIKQKPSFKFEVIVHDDASYDGTTEIIREYEQKYPHIIKPIYQEENQYSRKVDILKTFVYPKVRGKYVATCEGDDYWTDDLKLQKQVDTLDLHPEYSMCCTACMMYIQKTGSLSHFQAPVQKIFTPNQLLKDNQIANLTTMVRTDYLREYYEEICPYSPSFSMGDYPMWLFMITKGPVIQLGDVTATYRVLENSASHFTNPHKMIAFEVAARDVAIWANRKYRFGKSGLRIRKVQSVRRLCRHIAKKSCTGSFSLFLWGLYYMLMTPSPRLIKKL